MSKVKTILISQIPLPFSKIGSWSTMYQYLLEKSNFKFDYIICPKPLNSFKDLSYSVLRDITVFDKIKAKIGSNDNLYNNYTEALETIISKDSRYVIQIIDNSGIVMPIQNFLVKKYNRNNFFLQYCYHGFEPVVNEIKGRIFLAAVDEIIFLTAMSYKSFLNYYSVCPFKARVLHNGIDTQKFKKISRLEKFEIRKQLHLEEEDFVFMWCSQDRPKKGLHIVLDAFKKVYVANEGRVKLMIVGVDRKIHQEGVVVLGRVPNNELPKYYQISDVYLFPSLWKEGFGIVLAEALNSGCYVIASAQGGIPEVLNNGNYGVLIENPNILNEWEYEMNKAIIDITTNKGNPFLKNIPEKLYDIDDWAKKIILYINEAKKSFN